MKGSHLHLVTLSLCVLVCHISPSHAGKKIRCPPKKGGLLTSGDPAVPDPFHDVTAEELSRLYDFLKFLPDLNLGPPQEATVDKAFIYMVDLLLPPKKKVLDFLDRGRPQPKREARVMIFRGDKSEPVVEEYRVGPLHRPTYAKLLISSQRRNPVAFALRPLSISESEAMALYLLPRIDEEVGFILIESYGGRFTHCFPRCLSLSGSPKGTALVGQIARLSWITATYAAEYPLLYPLDFGVLLNLTSSDPTQWSVEQVWYSNVFYSSLSELADRYRNDPLTPKTVRPLVPADQPEDYSTIKQRGGPFPETPQRPPVQLELDGKRYSIHYRHVKYLQWSFHVRMSSFRGPQAYDVRYLGHRVAYELGLSDIVAFYSGDGPFKITDYVDSGVLMGTHTKALVEGADCPKGATFLSATFFGERMTEPITFDRSMCIFEHNLGVPLYRHISYTRGRGGFYGGMADSALIFRTILTVANYDYIVDMIFRQDGSLETRIIPTGYIVPSPPAGVPDVHGWTLRQYVHGNLHHHILHVKADLDIGGSVSNRYETLNLEAERVTLEQDGSEYNQVKFVRDLKETEKEAVYKFNFDSPKIHLVYNEQFQTEFGVPRAYRILPEGMSKQLLPEGEFNERTIPWARQQIAVTVYKEDEAVAGGSSPFGMYDSLDPVVDFSRFIGEEGIVDEDLVFWLTLGTYHLPHTEDLPVTPMGGGHLSFFLLPYNFYPENPALSSRDLIRVEHRKGGGRQRNQLSVSATLVSKDGFCGRITLKQLVAINPDAVLQTS